jgi:uncharacterized membrane protein (DUF485 family)
MKQFFPMGKGEALLLIYLIVMAVISFLPMWRTMVIGGMAVFGWLMTVLMITSPLLALLVFRSGDRAKVGKIRHDTTGIEVTKSEPRSMDSEAEPEA